MTPPAKKEVDLLRVLRTLTQAAAGFEKVAAHQKRYAAERKTLQDALTDAQLVVSVNQSWKVKEDDEDLDGRAVRQRSPRSRGGRRTPPE